MKYYAVVFGENKSDIYTSWPMAKAAIAANKDVRPRYKGFDTESEARQFIVDVQSLKNVKRSSQLSSEASRANMSVIDNVHIPKVDVVIEYSNLVMFTDGGAVLGKIAASAFVILDAKRIDLSAAYNDNVSVITSGKFSVQTLPITAQNAEVSALYRGCKELDLYITDKTERIVIYSDSEFSVKTLMIWGPKRSSEQWNGKAYKEMFMEILDMFKRWSERGIEVQAIHINSHTGIKYNEMVDKLATEVLTSN